MRYGNVPATFAAGVLTAKWAVHAKLRSPLFVSLRSCALSVVVTSLCAHSSRYGSCVDGEGHSVAQLRKNAVCLHVFRC